MPDIKPVKMCINITVPSIDDDSISLYEAVGILASKMQEAIAEVNKNLGILSTAYSESNPPPYPVKSVNGKTGNVIIDIPALPDNVYSADNPPPYPVKSVNNAITQNVQTVFITEGVDFSQIPQSELIAACKAGAKIAAEPLDDNTFNIYLMELLSQPERVVYYPLKQSGVTSVNNQIGAGDTFKAPISAATKESVTAITPDDTAVDGKPWTSKKTVDTLCPPLDKSGNPVICYPVAGYPLGVMVSWTPAQEGSGDPSPENIRPIQGRTEIKVERCGENLLNIKPFDTDTSNGITFEYVPEGGIHIQGTASVNTDSPTFPVWQLPPGKYYGLNTPTGVSASIVVRRNGSNLWLDTEGIFEILSGDVIIYWYMIVTNGTTLDTTIYPYIVPGATAPTTYTPYIGITNTLTLPSTVYGGEVDTEGKGQETWGYMDSYAGETLPAEWICDRAAYAAGTTPPNGAQVAYKLDKPKPFTATGGAAIPALSGTNTVLTDADSVTVTGRADPIQTIAKLSDRIAALEAAATNITE